MLYRVLILLILAVLAGCHPKPKCSPSGWCPNEVSPGISEQQYHNSLEYCSSWINSHSNRADFIDTIPRKALLYKACSTSVEGENLWYPCDLDTSLLVRILKNFNSRDSVKDLETRVNHISYANMVLNSGAAGFSHLYQNEDGSYDAICASKDSVKCDFLYANVVVSKKMKPSAKYWPKKYDFLIGEDFGAKDELSALLDSVYEKEIYVKESARDSLIDFDMCYKDGFAEPCVMDSAVVEHVRKVIKRRLDTLVSFTYQYGSWYTDQFFAGSVSSKHQCYSKDGIHCSELIALVRWNIKNWQIDTYSLGTCRFDLENLSYSCQDVLGSDVIRHDGLSIYKKDGTFVRNVP